MELSVESGAAIIIFILLVLFIGIARIVAACLRGNCGKLPDTIRRALQKF